MEGFQKRDMENRMNTGPHQQGEFIGDWTNGINDTERVVKAARKFLRRSTVDHELPIRLEAEKNPVANFKKAVSTVTISILFHTKTGAREMILGCDKDILMLAKEIVHSAIEEEFVVYEG
ncbi:UNVERIFIED_CONTAM: hypothetical protein Sradi_4112100 [Sesamum radiatum]|uniref:Uncharacterized protein n=1 Tax=Sesamum radiatum TaxID=300843 RepID=A0AAW2P414_SESRA